MRQPPLSHDILEQEDIRTQDLSQRENAVRDEVWILYIAGWGRSGSTILDTALGQVDGLVSVGELKFIWRRGLLENRRCGCGRPLRECPFWSEAFQAAYGKVPDDEFATYMDRHSAKFRTRHLPILLLPQISDPYIGRSSTYQKQTANLYRGILAAGGASVVIDSSKSPSYLALLARTAGLRLNIVHLVRDPRAVAYSWKRFKRDPDNPNTDEMPRFHPAVTATYWTAWNSAIERIGREGNAYMRIRYEDVVAAPQPAMQSLLEFAGMADAALPFSGDSALALDSGHTVSGNPIRFQTGMVAIRDDSAWSSQMSRSDRRWAEVMSVPVRGRYGY